MAKIRHVKGNESLYVAGLGTGTQTPEHGNGKRRAVAQPRQNQASPPERSSGGWHCESQGMGEQSALLGPPEGSLILQYLSGFALITLSIYIYLQRRLKHVDRIKYTGDTSK